MNDNSLQITIRNAFYRCTRLMHSKGKEYSPGEDRLENFKGIIYLTPENK